MHGQNNMRCNIDHLKARIAGKAYRILLTPLTYIHVGKAYPILLTPLTYIHAGISNAIAEGRAILYPGLDIRQPVLN